MAQIFYERTFMAEIYAGAVDKGLEGVVACTTAVSSILDVTLSYRGYTIEDLAQNSNFEEVTFLLWNDRLPNAKELESFKKDLFSKACLHPELILALKGIPSKQVHPMAWLRTATSLLSHWDPDAQDNSPEANLRKAIRLTAKMGLLITAFHHLREGREPVLAKEGETLAWNLLYTLNGKTPDPDFVKVLDTCLVLHADHELNCSAFAARVTASSLSDMYSAIVSAIGALKGPLHGGANEQVMVMLQKIGSLEKAKEWVQAALADKEKIMGFGHRVYKHGDPRAHILKKMSESLTKKIGQPHLYEMSNLIDETVQSQKGLLPNVDFYSATVYHSMGIPTDLFTPIFAASRVSGWIAHCFEQYAKNRIYRPRGQWSGKSDLKWQPLNKRT